MYFVDFHSHSNLSYDSGTSVYQLGKRLEELGKYALLTDHDVKTPSVSSHIISGYEKTLDCGSHLLVMYAPYIEEMDFFKFVSEVKSQGGVTIMPHPFRRWSGAVRKSLMLSPEKIEARVQVVDAVEIVNGSSGQEENNKALDLAIMYKKIPLIGSDAHVLEKVCKAGVLLPYVPNSQSEFLSLKNELNKFKFYYNKNFHHWDDINGSSLVNNRVASDNRFVQDNIKGLKPYAISAVSELVHSYKKKAKSYLKLDWNESDISYSQDFKDKLVKELRSFDWNHYPLIPPKIMLGKISRIFDISESQIILTNGSDDALRLICETFINQGDRVLAPYPGYDNFRVFAEMMGGNIEYVNFSPVNFVESVEACLKRAKFKLCYLISPHNPTGISLDPSTLEQVVDSNQQTLFVIDEAYADFSSVNNSKLVKKYENVIITRSFSKAYGLAFFRLGYLISSIGNVEECSKIHNPKTINGAALLAGEMILDNDDLITKRVEMTLKAKELLRGALLELGFKLFESCSANFLLVRSPISKKLFYHLSENDIFVRDLSHFKGYEDAIRITVPSMEKIDPLIEEIKKFKIKYNKKLRAQGITSMINRRIVSKTFEADLAGSDFIYDINSKRVLHEGEFSDLVRIGEFLEISPEIIGKSIFCLIFDKCLYLSSDHSRLRRHLPEIQENIFAFKQIEERGYVLTNDTGVKGIVTINPFFKYSVNQDKVEPVGLVDFARNALDSYGTVQFSEALLAKTFLDLQKSLTLKTNSEKLCFLSGGVDSRLMLSLFECEKSLATFTYYPVSSEDHKMAQRLALSSKTSSNFFWRGELLPDVHVTELENYVSRKGGTVRGILNTPYLESAYLCKEFDSVLTGFLGDPVMGSRVTKKNLSLANENSISFRRKYISEEKILTENPIIPLGDYLLNKELNLFIEALENKSDLCFLEFFDIIFRQSKYFGPEILAPIPPNKVVSPFIQPEYFVAMMSMLPKQRMERTYTVNFLKKNWPLYFSDVENRGGSKIFNFRKKKKEKYASVKYIDYFMHIKNKTMLGEYVTFNSSRLKIESESDFRNKINLFYSFSAKSFIN